MRVVGGIGRLTGSVSGVLEGKGKGGEEEW